MRQIQRIFIPGSEWLYIKIYGGEKTLDKLLGTEIYTIINQIQKRKLIHQWFFIRYADPDIHIRIRFLLQNPDHIKDIMYLFHKKLNPFIQEGSLWKIQLDTYTRELERYGNRLTEPAESLFHRDSECILGCIRLINKVRNENYRWMISLKMTDEFLNAFSYTNSMKLNVMEQLSTSFKQEFGFNEHNAKQFNVRFRENKKTIEDTMTNQIEDPLFHQCCKFIHKRTKKTSTIIQHIRKNTKIEKISLDYLMPSYIHMMLNRIFRSKNRIHEMVIYDFLRRYYQSEEAKLKYKK